MALRISSLVKFYTVLLLLEGPKHGYELMKALEERIGKGISTSQMYPFLGILQKAGYIQVKQIGSRDKIVYSLTGEGKRFTQSMLSRSGDLFYLALRPRVKACTHCGCKVLEGGHAEKQGKKVLMFCCHHCARSFRKGNRLR